MFNDYLMNVYYVTSMEYQLFTKFDAGITSNVCLISDVGPSSDVCLISNTHPILEFFV